MHLPAYVWWMGCLLAMTSGLEKKNKYTNLWLAEIHGGEHVAKRVARNLGFTFKGQASHFQNHYELIREDQPEYSAGHGEHFTRDLLDFDEVKWANQQTLVERVAWPFSSNWEQQYEDAQEDKLMNFLKTAKTSGVGTRRESCSSFFSCLNFPKAIMDFLRSIGDGNVKNLGKYGTLPMDKSFLIENTGVTKNVGLKSRKVSHYALRFNDPNWRKQWYIHDYRTSKMPVMDHNVVPVWKQGFTGQKVTVAILDVGVQHNHPDLKGRFDESLSYDVCLNKPGSMPLKVEGGRKPKSEYHGTSCAGVIAMVPDNKICGVGIAYGAKVAGIRMIGPSTTEYVIAKALSHTVDKFDIYSNSWTPPDNGYNLCTLDHMDIEAYIKGTTKGRRGKGSIYVQSIGNGKDFGNNCAANCYVNHIYAIGITSANQEGKPTGYSDRCAAIFATAYSGSGLTMEAVTTLDGDEGCNTHFSGTSAAVPIAAGIIALVLDSKPTLTYRDVMHLIAMTAEVAPLANNKNTWNKNGRGIWFSHDFGFGLLNAENMVRVASDWINVPERRTCIVSVSLDTPERFKVGQQLVLPFDTDACSASATDAVNFLEHIEVMADVKFDSPRGALTLSIRSPEGTGTILLEPRPSDINPQGLTGWSIMSVHNWGEDPKGEWKIRVLALEHPHNAHDVVGEVHGFTLKFHGTAEQPNHYKKNREYAAFRLPDGTTNYD